MRTSDLERSLKAQLARELCAILHVFPNELGASFINTRGSELSRIRNGHLRRFSLSRLIRFVASTGHDIEVHLKKTPRLEERPKPRRHPVSSVKRYDYNGWPVDP